MGRSVCIKAEYVSEDSRMSLLDNAYEDFTILNKSIVDDGYGGVEVVWTDGATIKGVMVFDNSTQMKVAQAMGVTSAYTLTVKKSIELDFHTVLRRESDKKTFRLTSNSDDRKTPDEAGLNMRQYSAEEWQVTS
jgi:hypothetical protein